MADDGTSAAFAAANAAVAAANGSHNGTKSAVTRKRAAKPKAAPADSDGAALLDRVRDTLTKYVIFPDDAAADAVTLYIAATHGQTAWQTAARLVVKSAEKRCGKTRLLEVCRELVHNRLATGNISAAALVRSITEQDPPTILMDEADRIFGGDKPSESTEILTGILNMGFARGWPYMRWNMQRNEREECPTFAMAVLASKGVNLPDTIEDRAVVLVMRRRMPGESVSEFRERDKAPLAVLRDELRAWASANHGKLKDAQPDMPVSDRAADVWESLTAIADLAGGHWPERARKAARAFTDAADVADAAASLGVRLLTDIRDVFHSMSVSFIESKTLLRELRQIEEAPWADFDLTTRGLADRLSLFGVKPGRNPAGTARGYQLAWFHDPFGRYLSVPPAHENGPEPSEAVRHGSDQRERPESKRQSPDGEVSESVRNRQTDSDPSDGNPSSGGVLTLSDGFGRQGDDEAFAALAAAGDGTLRWNDDDDSIGAGVNH